MEAELSELVEVAKIEDSEENIVLFESIKKMQKVNHKIHLKVRQ